jgi:phenylalanyl-tRNA synthetase beta chain
MSEAEARQFASAAPVEIENPLSEEATVMRTSLVPGMLEMLAWNLNRGVSDLRLFESGNVFELAGSRVEERKQICVGATGSVAPHNVQIQARPYSFFDLKGDVEVLLEKLEHRSLYFDAQSADLYHPGRSARAVMDGSTVAHLGQLHPEVAAGRKLRQEVYIAELYLDRLYRQGLRAIRYERIPRYPAVDRDFSFLFDNSVNFERIRAAVEALSLPELRRFQPVEIFRGGTIPAGKYSVLLRATFQSAERTLRDDEVALWSGQIIKALETLGGKLRA